MTDSISESILEPVEWMRLDDDLWRHVGCFLGLHALTLRRACSALNARVLAFEALPKATQECYRILKFLEEMCGKYRKRPNSLVLVRDPNQPTREERRIEGERMERVLRALPKKPPLTGWLSFTTERM